jgi:predicted peroxiredoxin
MAQNIEGEFRMGKILCVGTFATDDPTRATMPFIAASGALDKGHEPIIVLMGESTYLLKEGVVDAVQGIGFPPLSVFMNKMIEHEVPFYI